MSINGQPTEGSPLLIFDRAASTSDDDGDDGVDGLSMSKPVRIFCGGLALLQLGAVGYLAATPYAPEDPGYYHKVGCLTADGPRQVASGSMGPRTWACAGWSCSRPPLTTQAWHPLAAAPRRRATIIPQPWPHH